MENKTINTIIFDLGGVLIDWNPLYVFNDDYFDTTATRDYFFEHVCTSDWNENQDAGYPIAQATAEKIAAFPAWESAIKDFYGRWEEMLGDAIQPTVDIFKQLKQRGDLKFYALTNWSAETFPIALAKFDFLHWFDGRLVSGEEKTRKPFPAFYQLLLNRFSINPAQSLFIDDNLRNVKAAEQLGINSLHFTNALQLQKQLSNYGF
ncbi:MAG: Alpha-D-glucose-phosphate phosphatase YihX [Bacteroidota bacterium]|jgi:2-haloacid dehalogenase